ncbi:deoxyuridine 5'-triphosphate nucleotidohydrolase [Candidatus Micrarchaeota archaeon]|nr:deoxyuridine 5'-triphosphate nucleotidohydrolase [Candidatus Micrarchaeota archaeon]
MILPKHMIREKKVVGGIMHESQMQPIGVDLTLGEIHAFEGAGRIDFDNSHRVLPKTRKMEFENEIRLEKGCYKVVFNEHVSIPSDCAAFAYPRSSLLRCAADMHCAVWDPGYDGRSEAMLVVENPHGIVLEKNAKLAQLVFVKLLEEARELYAGAYKGENKK